MNPINIIVIIAVAVIVVAIIAYLIWRRVTGRGEDCAEAPLTGQNLVRKYHKMYGKKKKGSCCYCHNKEKP